MLSRIAQMASACAESMATVPSSTAPSPIAASRYECSFSPSCAADEPESSTSM
jgi:hypothetical protein